MLTRIEQVDVHESDSSPVVPITIVDCGELDRKDHKSVATENGNAWNYCEFVSNFNPFKDHKLFANNLVRAYISYLISYAIIVDR